MSPDATALEQLAALLASLLAQPGVGDMQAAFALGFTLPLICYLTAYFVGLLVNFWRN